MVFAAQVFWHLVRSSTKHTPAAQIRTAAVALCAAGYPHTDYSGNQLSRCYRGACAHGLVKNAQQTSRQKHIVFAEFFLTIIANISNGWNGYKVWPQMWRFLGCGRFKPAGSKSIHVNPSPCPLPWPCPCASISKSMSMHVKVHPRFSNTRQLEAFLGVYPLSSSHTNSRVSIKPHDRCQTRSKIQFQHLFLFGTPCSASAKEPYFLARKESRCSQMMCNT